MEHCQRIFFHSKCVCVLLEINRIKCHPQIVVYMNSFPQYSCVTLRYCLESKLSFQIFLPSSNFCTDKVPFETIAASKPEKIVCLFATQPDNQFDLVHFLNTALLCEKQILYCWYSNRNSSNVRPNLNKSYKLLNAWTKRELETRTNLFFAEVCFAYAAIFSIVIWSQQWRIMFSAGTL